MARKMSAEEKAVRDALAKFEKDFAASDAAVKAMNAGTTPPPATTTSTGKLDLTLPENAASARLQAQADAYFAANPDIDPLTGAKKTTDTKLKDEENKVGATNLPAVTPAPLARDTFINTLSLIMGREEASKPYVAELYKLVSGFYKSGSSITDAINLALYQAKTSNVIPEFTNRFSGIFKLQERRAAGEAIDVPTIAEYIKSQERLGTVLRQSGLGDLANETFLNVVMGTGKSVDESTSIVTDVFDLIDNAPKEWRAEVARTMPSASRADLARALLTGPEGVKGLERTVRKAGIVAAGTMQGLNISDTIASDLLSKNQSFATAGAQFAQVARILPGAQKLMSIESGLAPEKAYSIEQAVSATFDQNAAELQKLADLAERERARMSGRAGTIGSKSFASQSRGQGLI